MSPSRPFQWNSEVPPDSDPVHEDPAQDDDESAVVQATRLVRSQAATLHNIHQPPFTRLSQALLSAVRDDAFWFGSFSAPLRPDLQQALRAACLTRLNQLTPTDTAAHQAPHHHLSRHFVLLSLISPQLVLAVLCEWGARQRIHARIAAACHLVSALGNVSTYPKSDHEPPLLLVWLRHAFLSSSAAEANTELSRLCNFLSLLLAQPSSSGLPPLTVLQCLQHIVNPMLADHQAETACAVIRSFEKLLKNDSGALLEQDREIMLSTFDLLLSNCSFERRMNGNMRDVQAAIEAIGVLMPTLSPMMAEQVRATFKRKAPWLLAGKMRDPSLGDSAVLDRSRCLAHLLTFSEPKQMHSLLRQCESVIVFAACSTERWEGGQMPLEAYNDLKIADDFADPLTRKVWLAALVRHLPLLTAVETSTLFENVLNGMLPRALFFQQCPMHSRASCVGYEKWCRFVAFAIFCIRALMIILSSKELRKSVSSNESVPLRVTRSICWVFVALMAQIQKYQPPAFVFSSIFSKLHFLVAQCYDDHFSDLMNHSEIADVLNMTMVEIVRSVTMRDQERNPTQAQHIGEIIDVMDNLFHRNQLCKRISQAVLPLVLDAKARCMQR